MLLTFNMNSINPIQKYPHIVESYFISNEFSNFFQNVLTSKAIKVRCIFIIHI